MPAFGFLLVRTGEAIMFPQTPYSLYVYTQARQDEFCRGTVGVRLVDSNSPRGSFITQLAARFLVWLGQQMVTIGVNILECPSELISGQHDSALP